MVRISKLALLLSATTIAVPAEAAGPPIAYAKEVGSGFSIFVTNPNGTGTLKLYSGPSKNSLIVDMNPALSGGSNELAVVASRATGFKIIRYTDAGVVQPIQNFDDGCYVDSLDFHPTNGSLLVVRRCNNPQLVEVRVWSGGSYGAPIASTDGMNSSYRSARWLGDGSGFLVRYGEVGSGTVIQRRNMSNPSLPSTVWSSTDLGAALNLDTARCAGALVTSCMKFLYGDGADRVREVQYSDFGMESDTVVVANGWGGRYSPDNSRILHRIRVKGGFTLNVTNPQQQTAAKAVYNDADWRP